MGERAFRPWLVTLVLCVVVTVAMMVWMNSSGGYANPPWFLALGLSAGGTLGCAWLIVRNLIRPAGSMRTAHRSNAGWPSMTRWPTCAAGWPGRRS